MPFHPHQSPTLRAGVQASQLPVDLPLDHGYLRGDFTLWEIAARLDQSPGEIAVALKPFLEEGTLDLLVIPDLPQDPAALRAAPASTIAPTAAVSPASPSLPERGVPSSGGPPHQTPVAKNPTATRPLIACIDDSPVLAHSLKKILSSAGYQTLIIQEPMRGFSQLIEHQPALILLDLMLPNADGYSVCRFLRDTPVFAKTPIIVLTGQSKPVDRAKARLAGATEFLVKPPKPEHLLRMIQMHLDVALRT